MKWITQLFCTHYWTRSIKLKADGEITPYEQYKHTWQCVKCNKFKLKPWGWFPINYEVKNEQPN